MGFMLRFMLVTVLVLLCSWPLQTTPLHRQTNNGESQETDKLQKSEIENQTQSIVANLSEESNKPKTEFSTEDNKTIDKQNSVVGKLQKSESYKKAAPQPEVGRSIDIEKYVSKEFHNKNNVYTLPLSSDTEKYINPEFDYHATTHKHAEYSSQFDFRTELTTPKSSLFDHKYKEAVESVEQKLERIDDSHEISSSQSESKEDINLEKLYEETKKNGTEADLNYVNYKNITSNDTGNKNSIHKDLVVEAGTNLDFHSSYNHTTVIDEDDSGNNTIVKDPEEKKAETSTLSNVIPVKGDLDNAESATSKSIVLTTRKSIILTKPPSNKNSSHISILSNKIETETVKAVNVGTTTEKSKGETETVPEIFSKKTAIELDKRPFMFTDVPRTESNHINKKSEQLLQENQVIAVHIELPETMKNITTQVPPTVMEVPQKNDEQKAEQTSTEQKNPTTKRSVIEVLTTAKYSTTVTPTTTEVGTTTEGATIIEPETTTIFVRKPEATIAPTEFTKETEIETITSIVTETSVSWERVTMFEPKIVEPGTTAIIETTTAVVEAATTEESEATHLSTYLADSTAATITTEISEDSTENPTTTETVLNQVSESDLVKNWTITTENAVRTSKEMVYKDTTVAISETTTTVEAATAEVTTADATTAEATTAEIASTAIPEFTLPQTTTTELPVETTPQHTTQQIPEITTVVAVRILPEFKYVPTDHVELEATTENSTITSDYFENTDPPEDHSGTIAAITISSIGAVCLILLAGLLVIMRKRHKRFNYAQRCRPRSLDDYSMDSVSVHNSVRRKGMVRASKRSYGNPAFEDPVCTTHTLNFPALGKFANNLEDIKAEFEEIPQITARINELPEGCDTKNRYANVIPLPETRVFLTLLDGYPNSDYINANYVTGPKNSKGYYIACQAPLPNTVDDFWRMVWEQQCKVILMLTHLFENGVEKCVDYLPPSEVLDCHRLFGDFQVTLKKREVKDKYIISSLQLKNMVSNSWREVTHFWYLGWPEKGVPSEANSLIAFLIEARSYMKSSSLDREVNNGNLTNGMAKTEVSPVVVHCSPGTGRTGVVIACDIAIREFEQSRLVDVPRIVYKIRRDRASAVQTQEQYAFTYKVINLYAAKLTGGALDSL